jgi:hypothetical protein
MELWRIENRSRTKGVGDVCKRGVLEVQFRPMFFRVSDGRPWSGFYKHGGGRMDIWTMPDTAGLVARDIGLFDPSLGAALAEVALNASVDNRPVMLPRGTVRPALVIGEHIEFLDGMNLWPHARIVPGERGVCARSDPTTGEVAVFMTAYHHGLERMSNCAWLIPHDSDEVLSGVRLIPRYDEAAYSNARMAG